MARGLFGKLKQPLQRDIIQRDFGRSLPASGMTGNLPTMKRLIAASADIIYANQLHAASGKVISTKIMRNDGPSDAGAAHQTFRFGPVFEANTLNDNPTATVLKGLSSSNGAKDYALKSSPSTHGGSYHGGEVLTALRAWHGALAGQASPVILADGVAWDRSGPLDARKLQLLQSSEVTWSGTAGQTATIDSRLTLEDNYSVLLELRIESTLAGGFPSQNFPTLDFMDPRYTRLIYEGAQVDMAGNNSEYTLPAGILAARLLDPRTGDYADIAVTSDKAFGRVYVLFNSSYSKLYFTAANGEAMGVWNVSKRTTYHVAPKVVPALPYADTFDGTALSSFWFLAQTAGAPNSAVAGGEWVLTSNAFNNRFTHPICDAKSPGTYRVEIDYKTDAASTAAVAYILRHDSGSITGALQTFNLNSLAGGIQVMDVVVAEGESPVLMIQTGAAGRVFRLRELRISKTV